MRLFNSQGFLAVRQTDDDLEGEEKGLMTETPVSARSSIFSTSPWLLGAFGLSLILNGMYFASLLRNSQPRLTPQMMGQLLYSPAQSVLEYEVVVFDSAFGLNATPFSGPPSPESDAAWRALYDKGISQISAEEARPMGAGNKTLPIPGDPTHYAVGLEVFHVLHCLNQVRRAIYNGTDWTDQDGLMGITHIDHCIQSIRQNVMCTSDITPLVFARHPKDDRAKELMESAHSCRNFDALRQWSVEHQLMREFDLGAKVDNDPLGWGGIYISQHILDSRPKGGLLDIP